MASLVSLYDIRYRLDSRPGGVRRCESFIGASCAAGGRKAVAVIEGKDTNMASWPACTPAAYVHAESATGAGEASWV
jgi:hypothetical protein